MSLTEQILIPIWVTVDNFMTLVTVLKTIENMSIESGFSISSYNVQYSELQTDNCIQMQLPIELYMKLKCFK